VALRSLRIGGVYFRWRDGEVATLLRSQDGEVAKDVQRRAYAVQKRMKRAAGYRTGVLRRGIRVESVRESPIGPYASVVSSAPHTMVHELGRKEVTRGLDQTVYSGEYRDSLRFQPKRGASFIYRNRAAAVRGTHFMENSVDAALD
jgi:hypothetical protein